MHDPRARRPSVLCSYDGSAPGARSRRNRPCLRPSVGQGTRCRVAATRHADHGQHTPPGHPHRNLTYRHHRRGRRSPRHPAAVVQVLAAPDEGEQQARDPRQVASPLGPEDARIAQVHGPTADAKFHASCRAEVAQPVHARPVGQSEYVTVCGGDREHGAAVLASGSRTPVEDHTHARGPRCKVSGDRVHRYPVGSRNPPWITIGCPRLDPAGTPGPSR
jgi:hypothetical protein